MSSERILPGWSALNHNKTAAEKHPRHFGQNGYFQPNGQMLLMKGVEKEKAVFNDVRIWLILICLTALAGFIVMTQPG